MAIACVAAVAMADNDEDDGQSYRHTTPWPGRHPRPVPTILPDPTPEPTEVPTPPPMPTEEPTVTPEPTEEPTATPSPSPTPSPMPSPTPSPSRIARSYESWEYNPMPFPAPAPEPVALQDNNSIWSAPSSPASATPGPVISHTSPPQAVERTGVDLTAGALFAVLISLIGLELVAAVAIVIRKR